MNIATIPAHVKPNAVNKNILFYNTGVYIKYPSATNKATNISNI